MNPAVRDAAPLIRHFANGNTRYASPVARADARTSMADARIALCIAKGVPLDEIDPASGYSLTREAYDHARDSWRWHASHHGLTECTRPWLEEAFARWAARRPDFTDGDDWLAGVEVFEPHPEYADENGA
jgi:hypothetical protein